MSDAITPELAQIIAEAMTSKLIDVHTGLPATVQSYDSGAQTVIVELGVQRVLETDENEPITEDLPLLQNVPVLFPRVKEFFISFPISAGDTGLVIFPEMSIDQWRATGKKGSPGDIRRHNLTSAVFMPGLFPTARALTDDISTTDMAMGKQGGAQIRIGATTVEATSGGALLADDFVAMAGKVLTQLDALETQVNTHEHTYIGALHPGAPASTTLNDATYSAGAVASSNLKADD